MFKNIPKYDNIFVDSSWNHSIKSSLEKNNIFN